MDNFDRMEAVQNGRMKLKQSSHVGIKGRFRCRKCNRPFDRKNAWKNHEPGCNGQYDKEL